jgi:hypothetical protein
MAFSSSLKEAPLYPPNYPWFAQFFQEQLLRSAFTEVDANLRSRLR